MDLTPKPSTPWWSLFGCCHPRVRESSTPPSTSADVEKHQCSRKLNGDAVSNTPAKISSTPPTPPTADAEKHHGGSNGDDAITLATTSSTSASVERIKNENELEDRLGSVVKVLAEVEHATESESSTTANGSTDLNNDANDVTLPGQDGDGKVRVSLIPKPTPKSSKADNKCFWGVEQSNDGRGISLDDAKESVITQTQEKQMDKVESKTSPTKFEDQIIEPTEDDIRQRLKEANDELKTVREKRNKARTRKQRNALIKKEDSVTKDLKSLKNMLEKIKGNQSKGKPKQSKIMQTTPRKATPRKTDTPPSSQRSRISVGRKSSKIPYTPK